MQDSHKEAGKHGYHTNYMYIIISFSVINWSLNFILAYLVIARLIYLVSVTSVTASLIICTNFVVPMTMEGEEIIACFITVIVSWMVYTSRV